MSVKSLVFTAAVAFSALASGAQAATITFEGDAQGAFGGATQDGFDYQTQAGALLVNQWGHPGHDLEGDLSEGGGVLDIRASDLGLFTFDSIDYAAWSGDGAGSQILTLRGWLNGAQLGMESFQLANTTTFNPTYSNWTTFTAVGLAGVSIDRLSIELNGGDSAVLYVQAIDNVVLNSSSAVPEPDAWAMMILGFGLSGAALRRRRTMALA